MASLVEPTCGQLAGRQGEASTDARGTDSSLGLFAFGGPAPTPLLDPPSRFAAGNTQYGVRNAGVWYRGRSLNPGLPYAARDFEGMVRA